MEYVALGAGLLAILTVLAIIWLRRPRAVSIERARRAFDEQHSALEHEFFAAASASGKPRGLRWKACELGPGVELARDRRSGELLALAPVTISFEAIAGSDMEGLPAVGNLRSASAVFAWRDGRWITAGRAVFNLDPAEAIRHFRNQYEPVGPEVGENTAN